MAKRFTDSDKWKKSWFRTLSVSQKCFWGYLLDNCDHAGLWDVDFDLASFQIGESLKSEKILKDFSKQFIPTNNGKKWFIYDFVDFQYGDLNPKNHAHNSVINILKKNGVWDFYLSKKQTSPSLAPSEPLTSPSLGAQDKDKDQELDMDKELDQDQDKEKPLKEKKIPEQPFTHPWLDFPQFLIPWQNWLEMRKQKKTANSHYALSLAMGVLEKLSNNNPKEAVKFIDASILNGWKSFYPQNKPLRPQLQSPLREL